MSEFKRRFVRSCIKRQQLAAHNCICCKDFYTRAELKTDMKHPPCVYAGKHFQQSLYPASLKKRSRFGVIHLSISIAEPNLYPHLQNIMTISEKTPICNIPVYSAAVMCGQMLERGRLRRRS